MKCEKRTRKLPSGKDGVQSHVIKTPESDEEAEAAIAQATDARMHLQIIVTEAEKRLVGFPKSGCTDDLLPSMSMPVYGHSGYVEGPDDTLVKSTDPEHQKAAETIVDYKVSKSQIDPASPEYFAWMAKEAALAALDALDKVDIERAVNQAMTAERNFYRMGFGEKNEPLVVAALGSQGGRKKGGERKQWAIDLAAAALEAYPDTPKTQIERLLVEELTGEEAEIGEWRVYAGTSDDGNIELIALHKDGRKQTLAPGTFRTEYLTSRTKKQKK